jgi:hypothetical protein
MNDLTPGSSSKNANSVNAWLMVTGVSIRNMELSQKPTVFRLWVLLVTLNPGSIINDKHSRICSRSLFGQGT